MRWCLFRVPICLKVFPHMSQLYALTAEWVSWWLFNVYLRAKVLPHWSQLYGFTPLWRSLWFSKLCFFVKHFPHWSQLYALSPLWMSWWFFRSLFWVKDFPHKLHLNAFTPLWMSRCLVKFPALEKYFPQNSHLNGLSPVWMIWCLFRKIFAVKGFPHSSHLYILSSSFLWASSASWGRGLLGACWSCRERDTNRSSERTNIERLCCWLLFVVHSTTFTLYNAAITQKFALVGSIKFLFIYISTVLTTSQLGQPWMTSLVKRFLPQGGKSLPASLLCPHSHSAGTRNLVLTSFLVATDHCSLFKVLNHHPGAKAASPWPVALRPNWFFSTLKWPPSIHINMHPGVRDPLRMLLLQHTLHWVIWCKARTTRGSSSSSTPPSRHPYKQAAPPGLLHPICIWIKDFLKNCSTQHRCWG